MSSSESGAQIDVDRGLVGGLADLIGTVHGAPQGVHGRPGRGEELIGAVELAAFQRRDAFVPALLGDQRILRPAILPQPPADGGGDQERQQDEDQAEPRPAASPRAGPRRRRVPARPPASGPVRGGGGRTGSRPAPADGSRPGGAVRGGTAPLAVRRRLGPAGPPRSRPRRGPPARSGTWPGRRHRLASAGSSSQMISAPSPAGPPSSSSTGPSSAHGLRARPWAALRLPDALRRHRLRQRAARQHEDPLAAGRAPQGLVSLRPLAPHPMARGAAPG